jgi:hypothetical protein
MSEVNHPKHYVSHPSGIECIQVTEHMNFCLGKDIQDLEKAVWYLQREIARRTKNV